VSPVGRIELNVSPLVDVTVSIVNHENRDGVLASLHGLEADTHRRATVQLIVVDNASEDGSASAIRSAFPTVEVVQQRRRCGFGANHNAALRRAAGRHVLLLNDDTVVRSGAIDVLTDYLDGHPEVALAAPRIVNRAGDTQASAWKPPAPAGDAVAAITLGRRPKPLSSGRAPRRVGWAMGCALLARRASMLEVGGFDESYFMYSEEIDLARRLADLRLETHWVPGATVVHDGQVSTGGHASSARALEMSRSRRLYWRKNYSRRGRLLAQVSASAEFLMLGVASVVRGETGRPFWIQARGSWTDSSLPGLREQADEWNARAELESIAPSHERVR
jgi:GT2 family glycosyltransferase